MHVRALQYVVHPDREKLLDRLADHLLHVRDIELEERAAIGGAYAAFAVECDRALAERADELGPAVEPQHVVVPHAAQEKPVLDQLGRHVHQHHRVLLGPVRVARRVEHRGQFPGRVEDRRRRAGQAGILGEEMLVAMDHQWLLLHEARAHAVGALVLLRPDGAGLQGRARRCTREHGVTDVVEHHAVVVGQQDRVAGAGDLLVQVGHLGTGDLDQVADPLLAIAQLVAVDHDRFGAALGVECVILQATPPRRDDAAVYRGTAGTATPDGFRDQAGMGPASNEFHPLSSVCRLRGTAGSAVAAPAL